MTSSILVKVGLPEQGDPIVFDLADAWHIGLQGMTRSGKSVLVYGILGQLAHRDDVIVTGCDPSGITLNPWRHHPGSDLRSLTTKDADAHGTVMDELVKIMDQRIEWLMDNYRDKIDEFDSECPLILVVMEEYPGLLDALSEADAAEARKAAAANKKRVERDFGRLLKEGAKVGIRVLVLAQRMDASFVSGANRSNIGTRITLLVDNMDAMRMLHPRATEEQLDDLTRRGGKGVGWLEQPGQPMRLFRSYLIGYDDYQRRVRSSVEAA